MEPFWCSMIPRIKRIIFWASMGFLVMVIFRPAVFNLLDIEWRLEGQRRAFLDFTRVGIPVAVFLIFFSSLDINEDVSKQFIKVMAGILFPIFLYNVLLFQGICAYVYTDLYYHKYSQAKIVKRSFQCGAYDSDPPNWKIVEIRPMNWCLNRTREIDLKALDPGEWVPVTP